MASGWIEEKMDRHDRELLGKQMSQLQFAPRRDGRLILGMAGVFIAGLAVEGCFSLLGASHLHQRLSTMAGQL
jgi:hypothetical protein